MCTVSVVPHDQGFRLISNRDERETRPDAVPPARHVLASRAAVYPTDPQGGGTWIGSNDAELVLAILNRSRTIGSTRVGAFSSRGLIIPSLLDLERLGDVIETAALVDATFFEPFQLLALQRRDAAVLTSDGRRLSARHLTLDRPFVLSSSSLGDELVEPPRRRLFEEMVVQATDGWLQGQRRFHDHHWPLQPAISVRMRRPGARTVSRTVVEAREERIDLHYEALADVAVAA